MGANFIVAVDGPAAAGKSTTARLAAERLNFFYLDTGAMYRALTLKLLRLGMDPADPFPDLELKRIVSTTQLDYESGRWILDGEDVNSGLRSPEVDRAVSQVSALKVVREWMRGEQRRIALAHPKVICEGRDMGTVVFPDAQLKVYIDADFSERARRRHRELVAKGVNLELYEVEENLRFRDRYDSTREESPLRIPKEAVLLDTTHCSISEEVEILVRLIEERIQ